MRPINSADRSSRVVTSWNTSPLASTRTTRKIGPLPCTPKRTIRSQTTPAFWSASLERALWTDWLEHQIVIEAQNQMHAALLQRHQQSMVMAILAVSHDHHSSLDRLLEHLSLAHVARSD